LDTPLEFTIKIGPGEFVDRFTILQTKECKIAAPSEGLIAQICWFAARWGTIQEKCQRECEETRQFIDEAYRWLWTVHNMLWELEDAVRRPDHSTTAGSKTVARNYMRITALNDLRARIKREVDRRCNTSERNIEVKSHDFENTKINPDVFLGTVSERPPNVFPFEV
jgi:hypothetical protein